MITEAQRLGFRFGLEIRQWGTKGGGGNNVEGWGCLSHKSELKITRATVFLVSCFFFLLNSKRDHFISINLNKGR